MINQDDLPAAGFSLGEGSPSLCPPRNRLQQAHTNTTCHCLSFMDLAWKCDFVPSQIDPLFLFLPAILLLVVVFCVPVSPLEYRYAAFFFQPSY
jgi:hypothetical protein